ITLDAQGLVIEGAGRGSTDLRFASDEAFEISASFVSIRGVSIRRFGPQPTSGAGIRIIGDSAHCKINDITLANFFYNFDPVAARSWNLVDSYIYNAVKYNVYVRNTVSPDSGDQVIQGC